MARGYTEFLFPHLWQQICQSGIKSGGGIVCAEAALRLTAWLWSKHETLQYVYLGRVFRAAVFTGANELDSFVFGGG